MAPADAAHRLARLCCCRSAPSSGSSVIVLGLWLPRRQPGLRQRRGRSSTSSSATPSERMRCGRRRQPTCRQARRHGRRAGHRRGRHLALLRRAQRHRRAARAALAQPAHALGLRGACAAPADRLPGLAGGATIFLSFGIDITPHPAVASTVTDGRRLRRLGLGSDQRHEPPALLEQPRLARRGHSRVGRGLSSLIFFFFFTTDVHQQLSGWLAGAVGLGCSSRLVDRVKHESVAKTFIFLPLAISLVGASVIWRFVYAWRPGQRPQIGLLNAIWTGFGREPVPWLPDAAHSTPSC